jgi:antigen flippase
MRSPRRGIAMSGASLQRAADAAARPPERASSYRAILKSSALIGTSSLVNVGFGIIRTKAMAMLLGPSSFGLMGTYTAIVDLSRSIAQMGVNASGVRQIAQATATGDDLRTARTSLVLKRVALGTACLGAILLLVSSRVVSEFTFGTLEHAADIALLSLAVLFGVLAGGQTALIQGMRRISDLSGLAIIGAFAGTASSIALVYFLRERGLAASLVAGAAIMAVAGWFYSRRIKLPPVTATFAQSTSECAALLKLGAAFVAGDLLIQLSAYLVRMMIVRDSGLAAAGLYQAAWTIGGLYVGFVLQSMSTDFYPRLAGCISDKPAANLLVNQQAAVSILLAGPGVIATLAFAPLVVHLLYSAKFDGAIEPLRWICFGMALRTISWPMGFIVAASGRQGIFFAAELAWTVVNVWLTWIFIPRAGATGAGFAFFVSYIFHALMLLPVARYLTGFRWTSENLWLAVIYVGACTAMVAISSLLPTAYAVSFGALLCAGLTLQSAHRLATMSEVRSMPRLATMLAGCSRGIRSTVRASRMGGKK